MHYADELDYRGDWWLKEEHEFPYEILDRLRIVEAKREAGGFANQAEYDEAYWTAEGVTPPHLRLGKSIERCGLRRLRSLSIDSQRLIALQDLLPQHLVHVSDEDNWGEWQHPILSPTEHQDPGSRGLLVLSVTRDKAAKPSGLRWTSMDPLVQAIAMEELDGAVTDGALAKGEVHLAPTEKTIAALLRRSTLTVDREVQWRCLVPLASGGNTIEHLSWSKHWLFDADSGNDPRSRGIHLSAANRLSASRRACARALDEIELLLSACDGLV